MPIGKQVLLNRKPFRDEYILNKIDLKYHIIYNLTSKNYLSEQKGAGR